MKSIILCAGYGTRLYPLTKEAAKPLLPIRGKPVLEYICDKVQLLEAIDEAFIVVNDHFFNQFKDWLNDYLSRFPIKLINDGSKNNKGRLGAIRDLALTVDSENITDDVLVLGGDNLFDFSLSGFIKHSLNINPNPLIGVYNLNGRTKANKYGVVKLNERGQVIDFYEKPSKLNGSHLISLCLYYLPKETLHLLSEYINGAVGLADGVVKKDLPLSANRYALSANLDSIGNYIKWLAKNSQMHAFEFQGDWFDIGDIDSYTEAVCTF